MAISRDRIERAVSSLVERVGMRSALGGHLSVLKARLPRVARSGAPVLLSGGRRDEAERVARAVHYLSFRAAFPFIAVGCGSLPETSLQRALFGPEKTLEDLFESSGLVREASGGTLFLDRVERLGADAQGRLLRWFRGGEAGAVRTICGAEPGLDVLVEEGQFRRDLYYRINVISLALPFPAAERGAEGSRCLRVVQARSSEGDGNEGGGSEVGVAR